MTGGECAAIPWIPEPAIHTSASLIAGARSDNGP